MRSLAQRGGASRSRPTKLPLAELARLIGELAAASTPLGLAYSKFLPKWVAVHGAPLQVKEYGCAGVTSLRCTALPWLHSTLTCPSVGYTQIFVCSRSTCPQFDASASEAMALVVDVKRHSG